MPHCFLLNARSVKVLCLFCFLAFAAGSFAQCDTVYAAAGVETEALFPGGAPALLRYLTDHVLTEANGPCLTEGETPPASLYLSLVIDGSGKVVQVDIRRPRLSRMCTDQLSAAISDMPDWIPATIGGKAVCSQVSVPVSCIKWE